MAVHPEAVHWLTLSLLPGLGCTLVHRLVEHWGSASAVLLQAGAGDAFPRGVGPKIRELLSDPFRLEKARQTAREELLRLESFGAVLLCPESCEFPSSLLAIADPPAVLFCQGDLSLLSQPSVALIGSRAATEYGRRVARQLGRELSQHGLAVVSGAAYGIDGAAHTGALENDGKTVAILGCGLDVAYPKPHAALLAHIAAHGALLSEYPLTTQPEAFRFPARNRLISGLAAGVVVVEATEKSGSLITAALALDQGKEVMALPGRVDSPKSSGTHLLIRQGAHLVRHAGDILETLAWQGASSTAVASESENAFAQPLALNETEKALLAFLEPYGQDIDTLARRTGFSVVVLQATLLQLELAGRVRQLPGQLYECVNDD
nr:DNA-processing protein DprA [uncultured Desulfobulbus sp.]